MSENPFKDPPPELAVAGEHPGNPAGLPQSFPPVTPGGLTPILVFCLMLGILGLIGNCIGGGMLLAMPMLTELVESTPLPEEQKAFNRLAMGSQKAIVLPQILLISVNFVVATMLIIGSIGCFKRKESSRGFLRLALLAAVFYSILKLAITGWAAFAADKALRDGVEGFAGDPIYEDLQAQLATNFVSTIGTQAVLAVIGIAIMIFYIWARSYLGKKIVEDHFLAINEYRGRS